MAFLSFSERLHKWNLLRGQNYKLFANLSTQFFILSNISLVALKAEVYFYFLSVCLWGCPVHLLTVEIIGRNI